MFKIIVYTNRFEKKSARLVADLGYRQVVLSWDTSFCAEILKIAVADLLDWVNGEYVVK